MANIKKQLIFLRQKLLLEYGIKTGKIQSIDFSILESLKMLCYNRKSVFDCFYNPEIRQGHCFEFSLFLSIAFENCVLVEGAFPCLLNGEDPFHTWVEVGDTVYDGVMNAQCSKSYYYKMYNPFKIKQISKRDMLNDPIYLQLLERFQGEYGQEPIGYSPIFYDFLDHTL